MKKKKPIILLYLTFHCENCNNYFHLRKENMSLSGDVFECLKCGSHGDITLHDVECTKCGNKKDIVLKDW